MDNPLLDPVLRYPFDKIRTEHIEPAFAELLGQSRARLAAIASEPRHPRNYESTLGALDDATEELDVMMTVVSHLESVVHTPELRAAHNAVKPEYSTFAASIPLDAALWSAIRAYASTEDAKSLTGARKRFLEKTIDDFKQQGAELDESGKAKLKEITRELAEETNRYSQNVLDATAAFDLYLDRPEQLAGLPASAIEAAKESATSKGRDGFRFTLHAPSMVPLLTYLDDAKIREHVYRAYCARATTGTTDNRPRIQRILELRREKARLLSHRDFADLVLHDRMAHDGQRAREFVRDLTLRTRPFFVEENRQLARFRLELEGRGDLNPWDLAYYAEKQRKLLFDFDEEELRPYFPIERVLSGLFEIARRIYGVRVETDTTLPSWHSSVGGYALKDGDGTFLGMFYTDFFPRDEKRGGAWMNGIITGVADRSGNVSPHLGLICANVNPPIGDRPALLTHQEVETLFHEFGHLLHHMLSRVEVRSLAGTNVAWDFVELPSQIMENWCWEREALNLFARREPNGDLIPEELFSKMAKARTYRAANAMMRQLGFAAVDLSLHTDYDETRDGDVIQYSRKLLQDYSPVTLADDYAFIASFSHLFSSEVGYAAGYYSYKWAEVLDADAFTRFSSEGLFNEAVGRQFRSTVLERGNGDDPRTLYRAFMGREPSLDALLARSGLR